ncbi:YibE/F family protein [Dethiobacter alkaliphilus]|uniref:YibE/F family protein n=1 Tax=Dethiobacter alkaliphilus TaxID=427926 RepID=UPI002225F4BB|nr:YibE/F family protein [Dethiobacter alkaliphilus]MCW3488880.1 YibE/F family protein [Dethiobacter alkaliphilus]
MTGKSYQALRYAGLFLLIFLLLAAPAQANEPVFSDETDTVDLRGRVISVEDLEPDGDASQFVELEQLVTIEITSGPFQGQQHTILNELMGHPLFDIYVEEGRQVILWGEVDPDDGTLLQIYLQDYVRDTYLYYVIGLFVLVLVVAGGKKGLLTLVTLTVTIALVARVLLPLLLQGYPPIPTTLGVAVLITLITLLGIGGLQRKTLAAVIGTAGGVAVAGVLALLVGNLANLTGFSSEEAQMLMYMEGTIDVRGLLFAGIIVGALGAVMDVAMSIASASHEVYCANPAICVRDQFRAAMNVGRDVMGTMANTLILAYLGTSMSLLLLFMGYEVSYSSMINMDLVATEVIRALSGSIGLVTAVPLTALFAGLLTVRTTKPAENSVNK